MALCSIDRAVRIEAGALGDYGGLARFHYRGGWPRGVSRVLVARIRGCGDFADGFVAGVAVESFPVLNCALRGVALPGRFCGARFLGDRRAGAMKLNHEMRTISRVVVHPVFRGMGLGVRLVRRILETAEVPFVETLAAMGRYSPLFERAGMRRFEGAARLEVARLRGALATAGFGELDLVDLRARDVAGELRGELRRFARKKEAGLTGWLAEARERVLSPPLYYLWERGFGMATKDTKGGDCGNSTG